MTNTTELRKRFDKTVLAQDGLIHKAEEAWEDYCRNSNGFVPKFWCSRFFPSDDILKFTQSEIEAAEKAKEKQFKEATVKFFKEQKEIAQIRGDAFWVHEFDLQIFGQPLNGCSLFLKNPEQ